MAAAVVAAVTEGPAARPTRDAHRGPLSLIVLAASSLRLPGLDRDPVTALAPLLARRGIALCRVHTNLDEVAAVLVGPDDAPGDAALRDLAARLGVPVLALGESWITGRLRVAECGADGVDRRLCRLAQDWGRLLDHDAVDAAVGSLPAPTHPWLTGVEVAAVAVAPDLPQGWHRAAAPERLGPLARKHGLALTQTVDTPGAALLAAGDSVAAWDALAQGRELVCLGSSPFTGLNLVHEAAVPDALSCSLASLAAGRRSDRDEVRRTLASEALFNAFPGEPAAIAAVLDEAIHAVGRRPLASVSIVITSHNYREYLGAAIASALGQTVRPREVVVVDDGSTDGSAELVVAAEGIEPVLQACGGQAAAFNAGFARTTGDIVLFLDADDRLGPDAVERLGAADRGGASRLCFGLEVIDAAGRSGGMHAQGVCGGQDTGFLAGALVSDGIFWFVPTSGNAFPRWALEALLPMPEPDWRLCADLYLVMGAALLGDAIDLGAVLGQYRIHGRNGYFERLHDQPWREEERIRQRLTVWRQLVAAPPAGLPNGYRDRMRMALHRKVLQVLARRTAHDAPLSGSLREAARAVALALACITLPARERLGHALLPARLALGWAPKPPPVRAGQHDDLITSAGPAKWPRLGPGHREIFTSTSTRSGALGGGWSVQRPDGVQLTDREAKLAFRLPDIASHWRLRLDFAVADEAPIRGLEVTLNGTLIETLDLHRLGVIDLALPAELLADWTKIAPGSGPGARAAVIGMRVRAADAGRLTLSALRLEQLPQAIPPAPLLRVSELVAFRSGGAAGRLLGEGWHWPDAQGAPLAGNCGRIRISCAEAGEMALTLGLAVPPGCSVPVANLQVVANDVLLRAHWTAPAPGTPVCGTLAAVAPAGTAGSAGRLELELRRLADPDGGDWPAVRLTGLRLDRRVTGEGAPVLTPNLPVPAAAICAHPAASARGLVADGGLARIADGQFRVELRLAPVPAPAWLVLGFRVAGALAGPVAAELALGERTFHVALGAASAPMLELPDDAGYARSGPLLLTGRLENPRKDFVLHTVELRTRLLTRDAVAPPRWSGGGVLQPADLAVCATVPEAWHPPVEDAIWLAAHTAELRLPPPPPGTAALAVDVLSLGDLGQRLELSLGLGQVVTERSGPESLILPVPPTAADGLRLRVTCDRLVSADLVGAAGPVMLGGAICRIVPLTTASTAPRERRERRPGPIRRPAPAGASDGV